MAWILGRGDILRWDGRIWSLSGPAVALPRSASELRTIGGSAEDDVWIAGDNGLALHWDGCRWQEITTGSNEAIRAVRSFGKNEAWAAASQHLLHWDGQTWERVADAALMGQTFEALWATSPNQVWANGTSVVRRQNSSFEMVPAAFGRQGSAIWGSDENHVWSLGVGINFWNGSSWSGPTVVPTPVRAATGTSATDAWAGGNGFLAHWDGIRWSNLSIDIAVSSLAAARDGILVLAAHHALYQGRDLIRIWREGRLHSLSTAVPAGGYQDLQALSSSSVFATDAQSVWFSDGATWTNRPPPPGTVGGVRAIWADSPSSLWVASVFTAESIPGISHWDGANWEPFMRTPRAVVPSMIRGLPGTVPWIVIDGEAHRWTGAEWKVEASSVVDLIVAGASSVWMTQGIRTSHWDGTRTLTQANPANVDVTRVRVSPSGTLWMAGRAGKVMRSMGGAVVPLAPALDVAEDLGGVVPFSDTDVWVMGRGRVFHFDGATWKTVKPDLGAMSDATMTGTGAGGRLWLNVNGQIVQFGQI